MTSPTHSARQVAELSEVAGFVHFLALHVDHGGNEEELQAAMAALIRKAKQAGIGVSTVVGAVELVGCQPLHDSGPGRVDRYTGAMAALLRSFLDASS